MTGTRPIGGLGDAGIAGYCLAPMKSIASQHCLPCAALRRSRACHRRRRRADQRRRRPRHCHHRRLARQFLHRRADRAKNRADGRALRAARRGLQDRRDGRRPSAEAAGHQSRRDPSRVQDGRDDGASCHRRRGAIAIGRTCCGKSAGGAWRADDSRHGRQPFHHRRHRRHRARRWQERRHHPRRRPGRHRQAGHAADPPGRSRRPGRARGDGSLHRRFRRAGVRGQANRSRDRRRHQLVDRTQHGRRLRRPHRRHAADAVSRLDFANGTADGREF